MAALTDAELLTTFDRQIRRRPGREAGFDVELVTEPAPMLRMTPTATDASWGGGVFWCDLDETNADAAIADAVEHFRPFGREFEWKHYGYDEPRDLTDRLAAAGFTPDEEEALVVGEVAVVRERLASAAAAGRHHVPAAAHRRRRRGRRLAGHQRPARRCLGR